MIFRWSHSRNNKSFRLNRKIVKRPVTDVHMLDCEISSGNYFREKIFLNIDF